MTSFSNTESTDASSSDTQIGSRDRSESSRSGRTESATISDRVPTLEMNQCPECGTRRFVSKLLVYEVTSYDEGGEQEFRRQHVRAEFKFTCGECETVLRTLPADQHDYYDEVEALAAERRAVLRNQVKQLCGTIARRLWSMKSWLAFILLTVAVAVIGL